MPVTVFGADWRVPDLIRYKPAAGDALQFTVLRGETPIDGRRPLLLWDTEFTTRPLLEDVGGDCVGTGARDWDPASAAKGRRLTGAIAKPNATFDAVRKLPINARVEMTGAMMAVCRFAGETELLVSVAANRLCGKGGYSVHLDRGDNDDGQVHVEMFFAAQLEAFFENLTQADARTPALRLLDAPAAGKAEKASRATAAAAPVREAAPRLSAKEAYRLAQERKRAGTSAAAAVRPAAAAAPEPVDDGSVVVDVDMFIEKKSLCEACSQTWSRIFSRPTEPRVRCTYRNL